jgi:hypothetical protein
VSPPNPTPKGATSITTRTRPRAATAAGSPATASKRLITAATAKAAASLRTAIPETRSQAAEDQRLTRSGPREVRSQVLAGHRAPHRHRRDVWLVGQKDRRAEFSKLLGYEVSCSSHSQDPTGPLDFSSADTRRVKSKVGQWT